MPTIAHPSTDELIAFAQGALDDARSAVVEVHVFQCEPCAGVVATAPNDDFVAQVRESRYSLLGDGDDAQKRPAERQMETVAWPPDVDRLARLPRGLREHPQYDFKQHLATGAMGDVYLALDRTSSKLVAVKVLKPEVAGKAGRKSRFFQETRIAMRLRHPNIAQVLHHDVARSAFGSEAQARRGDHATTGFGDRAATERAGGRQPPDDRATTESTSAGEAVFFAMEYVEGETLSQLVAERGPLPVAQAADYVRQVALGLQCAHDKRVVHRDIKPHNLMLERQTGRIKILDFGLGRLVDEQRSGTRLTKEGEILGTLGYLSPEQAANSRQTDIRCDIYSLGCTFFFLLTGFPPFRGRNAVELLNKHLNETPPPIRSLRPDVPADIATLLDRMLAKDPARRPQSPRDVAAALVVGVPPLGGSGPAKAETPMGAAEVAGYRRIRSALLSDAFSPAIVLPLLTLLICLIWLLISSSW
jgi:serine/threonine protein kinase